MAEMHGPAGKKEAPTAYGSVLSSDSSTRNKSYLEMAVGEEAVYWLREAGADIDGIPDGVIDRIAENIVAGEQIWDSLHLAIEEEHERLMNGAPTIDELSAASILASEAQRPPTYYQERPLTR